VAQTPQNSLVEEIKQRHRPPPIPAKPKHLLSPIQILEGAIQGIYVIQWRSQKFGLGV